MLLGLAIHHAEPIVRPIYFLLTHNATAPANINGGNAPLCRLCASYFRGLKADAFPRASHHHHHEHHEYHHHHINIKPHTTCELSFRWSRWCASGLSAISLCVTYCCCETPTSTTTPSIFLRRTKAESISLSSIARSDVVRHVCSACVCGRWRPPAWKE